MGQKLRARKHASRIRQSIRVADILSKSKKIHGVGKKHDEEARQVDGTVLLAREASGAEN